MTHSTGKRAGRLVALMGTIGVTVAALSLTLVVPAGAVPNPGDPIGSGPGDIATETTIGQLLNIGSVNGGQNPAVEATTPYPGAPGVPVSNQTTAQAVLRDITDQVGPIQGLAYCIDLNTDTTVGVNYRLGPWTDANVPNLTYVNYILTHYFPNVPSAPAGTAIQKVEAVQAAIWYFTDHFVLAASDPVRAATEAIVLDAQNNAGGIAPPLPTLTISPSTAQVPTTGDIVGPFTVGGTAPSGTLQALGVQVFADAAGTQPLADGATVAQGSQLWMKYLSTTTPQGFRLTAIQSVVQGNVFLYDGSNAGRSAAQKLILAQPTDLPIRAGVTATPYDASSIQITKAISGAGAGLQGDITITATCTDGTATNVYTTTLAAGAGAGSHAMPVISPIPVEWTCTLVETGTGANASVVLTSSSITPDTVAIDSPDPIQVAAADEYDPAAPLVGSLQITKSIAGGGAGLQGPITITATCVDGTETTVYTTSLPANAASGAHLMPLIAGIVAGSTCTLAETRTGASLSATLVSSVITPPTVTIGAGLTATADASNVYDPVVAPAPTPTPASGGGGTLADTGSSDSSVPVLLAMLMLAAGTMLALRAAGTRRPRRE
ncbi:thioester domain-containing protein [Leifsonia aquatica]|uniref:thioester domain-containing protein n=1 Tax=Leifsonia aquatica TaxID=144185 RepID=UPI0037FB7700